MVTFTFYGNRQAGLVALLAALAGGNHRCMELWLDLPGQEWWGEAFLPGVPMVRLGKVPFPVPRESELLLCCHGRRIIPKETLAQFPLGGINLHPFLKEYPGASPVARALRDGVEVGYVAAHWMTEEVDAGEEVFRATGSLYGAKTEVEAYNELYPLYAAVTCEVMRQMAQRERGRN